MVKKAAPSSQRKEEVTKALRRLETTLTDVSDKYEYTHHPGKQLFLTFLKGIMSGLGFICAIAIVIPLVVSLLRGIEWVPLVGDFVSRIATEVEQARHP